MATKAEKNFEKALLELAGEDVSTALSVLTGCFVSLTLEVLRRKGHVPDGDIKIDGGDQRDITIHPPKAPRDERAPHWRDVAEELPQEAQEVLFVRGGKTVHGAWIGGIFWHSNQKMAAAKWMPLPLPPNLRFEELKYRSRA